MNTPKTTEENISETQRSILPTSPSPTSFVVNENAVSVASQTTSIRAITSKDLGGIYDALVPILDWERYLDVEYAWFKDRIQKKKITYSNRRDFKFISEIGKGSFGRVALVVKRDSRRYYAAKFISKKVLNKSNVRSHIINERNILYSIRFTFTIYLEYFIQDLMNMYFIVPIALGGNLHSLIKRNSKLPEKDAKFYVAQIILALEYLHHMNLIFRDLKPENILIDHFGFIKLADFGFCKVLTGDKTYTMCGTSDYLAPEVIKGRGYNKTADWWSLGVLIYHICSGRTPFASNSKAELYKKISECDYICPNYFTESVQMLLWNLLKVEVTRRFGGRTNGVKDIKNHEWFSNIQWLPLVNRQVVPPFKPNVILYVTSQNISTALNMDEST